MKRQIIENLLLEIGVGKDNEGNPTLRIVYAFDGNNLPTIATNQGEGELQNFQLQSSRMSVQLLRISRNRL